MRGRGLYWKKQFLAAFVPIMTLLGCGKGDDASPDPNGSSLEKTVPAVSVVKVRSEIVSYRSKLPAELTAYRNVGLYPRVAGFVKWMGVDRGSLVKKNELIISLEAPELTAQKNQSSESASAAKFSKAETERRQKAIKAQIMEGKAKLASEELTFSRMKQAFLAYPGSVIENEVDVAERKVEALRAYLKGLEELEQAAMAEISASSKRALSAKNSEMAAKQMERYLQIYAPFDGVITERNVHEGSFVSPPAGTGTTATPLVRLKQRSLLRLVVAVPETELGKVVLGTTVSFGVPAFPDRTFTAKITRIGHALDVKTRTMPIELDVHNKAGGLEPGMYAEVHWPVRREYESLLVPQTAVFANTEKQFVIRVKNGVTEWVDVKVGKALGDMLEIFGDLSAGDAVVLKASDELEGGKKVMTKAASS